MKRYILAIFLLCSIITIAQEQNKPSSKDWRKMSRIEKRVYNDAKAEKKKEELLFFIENKAWVLEAHSIQDHYGETYIIVSNLNFIGVSGNKAVVQLGSNLDIGENGIGGITLEGNVSKYEYTEGKKTSSPINIQIAINGASSGYMHLSISISPNATASATITDIYGERLTYHGELVPTARSMVYQGLSSY